MTSEEMELDGQQTRQMLLLGKNFKVLNIKTQLFEIHTPAP